MRKFIVSDLHGDINTYNAIMGYLENISKYDEVILYINGDLIDRGIYSADMLIDIKNRIENENPFKIEYLAGNHELMMWQAYPVYKNGTRWDLHMNTNWGSNGGSITAACLEDELTIDEEDQIFHFIKKLKLYHKFEETINDKKIVLAHAACPKNPLDICDLTIEDVANDITNVVDLTWSHKEHLITPSMQEKYDLLWKSKLNRMTRQMDFNIKLGNDDFFTIIGHTPVENSLGYEFYESDNVLNIDGGEALYWRGYFEFDHSPLVEIDSNNNRLIILTFNHNNEIIYGTYLDSKITYMNNSELENHRKFLDKNTKIYKLDKDLFS